MNENEPKKPTSSAVADRSEEFVAVEGGQETSSAGALLTTAYILMWFFVFGFVWLTSRKLKNMDGRINELSEALKVADAVGVPDMDSRVGAPHNDKPTSAAPHQS